MKPPAKSYKWELLALLWCAYFLNQGDRQIFNVVIPLIKAELGLNDVQLGLVATVFTMVYGLLVPVAGILGDKISRKYIVCLSLGVFSLGTLCTGVVGGLMGLIVMRSITTGGGEAFYYPSANAMIGEYHHRTRAQAMGIHQTSLYVGIVASSWLTGIIAEHYGWRSAFFAFGSVGIVLTSILLVRLKRDPVSVRTVHADAGGTDNSPQMAEILGVVLRKRSFYYLSLAFAGMVFVNIGFMTWMPTFLYEKFSLSLSDAALQSTLGHYVCAFLGVLVGGRISDRMASRRPSIRFEVEIAGLLLGAPFIYLMGTGSSLMLVYVAMALFGFFRGVYDSNLFAALFDVIPPRYRASATGLMLFSAFILGSVAPYILALIKQRFSLDAGLASLSLVYAVSAGLIFIALKVCFRTDLYREDNTDQPEIDK